MSADAQHQFHLERLESCPLCGTTAARVFASSTDRLMGLSAPVFRYLQCETCGVVYQAERPTEATIAAFYAPSYGPYGRRRKPSKLLALPHKAAMKAANWITGLDAAVATLASIHAQRLQGGGAFMDFGCGYGTLLDKYRKRFRCETIGVDFNADVLAKVSARGHQTVLAAELRTAIPEASINLVVMNHVLEHLYAPEETLRALKRVLRPGGLIDIATPNPEGLSSKTFGADWFGLDAPRHVLLYGPNVAADMLRACGFHDVRVIPKPVTKDYLRSCQRAGRMPARTMIERDGFRALGVAPRVRDAAQRGDFDQYHLIARA